MARAVCAGVKAILSTDDPLSHKELITQVINVVNEEDRLMKVFFNVYLTLSLLYLEYFRVITYYWHFLHCLIL